VFRGQPLTEPPAEHLTDSLARPAADVIEEVAPFNFRTGIRVSHGGRFAAVGAAGFAVSALGVHLMTEHGVSSARAKALTIPVVVTAQFLANKYWSFAHRRATTPPRR
jgi:hypothetical protein